MSWEEAREEAEKWLKTLPIPKDVKGKTIDLMAHAHTIPESGKGYYRLMILRAAARIIKTRGGEATVWDDRAE